MVERERKEGELEKRKDARMVSSFEPNDRHGLILLYKRSRYDKADAFYLSERMGMCDASAGGGGGRGCSRCFFRRLLLRHGVDVDAGINSFTSFHCISFPIISRVAFAVASETNRFDSIRSRKLEHKSLVRDSR